MKKFLCYDTEQAARGEINVDSRGILKPVDSELSDTSTNPVQNKVIKSVLDALSEDKLDKTGTAADSGKLGGQLPEHYATAQSVNQLKNDVADKVDASEMSACELIEIPASSNLCDMVKIKQNTDTNPTTGVESSNEAYCIYYVDVKPGMNLYVYVWDGSTASASKFRFVSAFNEDGTINPDKKQTVEQSYYAVPDGIYRVCLMMYQRYINENKKYIITTDENIPTEYEEYRKAEKHYVAKNSFFDNVDVLTKESIQDGYMEKVPYNMLNPEEVVWNKLINAAGVISDNSSYYLTGYIPVDEGDLIRVFTRDLSPENMRSVCAFDSEKIAINGKGSNSGIVSYTVPNGIKYIRISLNYNTNWTYYLPSDRMVTFAKSDIRFMNYGIEDADKHRFRSEFAPAESANLHVYLPPEIDVGIGRTVELYNELVCLEANKYHMQWRGTNGVQYANKYSIYGRTAGQSSLTLNIFNDSMGLVWTGKTTVVVSENNISSTTNIIPIGDSLTNMKPWLSEVQNLSGGKIKWIGTRHRSDQPESPYHEGRSGYSAGAYLTDSSYTFDSNYAGSPSVSGTANPFWDGTKFSLAHYVQTQGATIGIPDAVMLLLGTNDIAIDATDNVANIKAIVTSIRSEYASMPIFVCNTIYRSNQNGYYSAGSDNYTSASDWAFSADMKIMNLQNALSAALAGMENVYIVPLSVCMDREHNFGQVDAAVNPRLTSVTIKIPNESVHPQESGYLQMADVMYSSFVAHLS